MFIDPKGAEPSRETKFANALCELDKDWKQQVDAKPMPHRSRFKLFTLFILVAIVLYALSMGPADALVKSLPRRSPRSRFAADVYQTIYYPMFLLREFTPFAVPIDAYLDFWEAKWQHLTIEWSRAAAPLFGVVPGKMRTRRLLICGAAGIVAVLVLVLVASAYWERRQTPFQNLPGLITALQAYVRDQTAAGRRLPAEIPLSELVRGGYLTTNDVRAFEGMDVAFGTQVDGSQPQSILARARMPDGQFICVLADGSVQQFSRERYEEATRARGTAGSSRSP
jgi:hypothetical protein